MADCCSGACASTPPPNPRYRRALWIALLVNALMFGVELFGSVHAASVSLLADSIDFLGDAGNYAISLFVLALGPLWRARAALFKGITMGVFGVIVLGRAAWVLSGDALPEPLTMGAIGVLALLANGLVAVLLFAFRDGDANMRSVWLCTRNDMIGNAAVLLAALGVFGSGSAWPDLAVAAIMAVLGLTAAREIIGRARAELAAAPSPARAGLKT